MVTREAKNKRDREGRCLMCGRRGYTKSDCLAEWKATTPPPRKFNNPNQLPVNKKARTDKGHFRIMELGFKEDKESANK